jgi:hypothetical protein
VAADTLPPVAAAAAAGTLATDSPLSAATEVANPSDNAAGEFAG